MIVISRKIRLSTKKLIKYEILYLINIHIFIIISMNKFSKEFFKIKQKTKKNQSYAYIVKKLFLISLFVS